MSSFYPLEVDVVQHPAIGVISENYIDRFPHHAYAPTESMIAEAPGASVNYEQLFGAGQRAENNNWELVRTERNCGSVI
ncbi:hypothetical protein IscW_ISCW017639 [Ixodes scapularis]|uniref:Uncharacterized protein n=1 Tax=Ixodes scapularis TaxID=6945 RepID=B7PI67_IXOSC|nr:hypothetical protein IscW_ISCW017639 [Ixodes scapularis]|eukprot:XP_002404491.1 hypothetical protein IscW_ISCW017639 [Ixodes scapularis]